MSCNPTMTTKILLATLTIFLYEINGLHQLAPPLSSQAILKNVRRNLEPSASETLSNGRTENLTAASSPEETPNPKSASEASQTIILTNDSGAKVTPSPVDAIVAKNDAKPTSERESEETLPVEVKEKGVAKPEGERTQKTESTLPPKPMNAERLFKTIQPMVSKVLKNRPGPSIRDLASKVVGDPDFVRNELHKMAKDVAASFFKANKNFGGPQKDEPSNQETPSNHETTSDQGKLVESSATGSPISPGLYKPEKTSESVQSDTSVSPSDEKKIENAVGPSNPPEPVDTSKLAETTESTSTEEPDEGESVHSEKTVSETKPEGAHNATKKSLFPNVRGALKSFFGDEPFMAFDNLQKGMIAKDFGDWQKYMREHEQRRNASLEVLIEALQSVHSEGETAAKQYDDINKTQHRIHGMCFATLVMVLILLVVLLVSLSTTTICGPIPDGRPRGPPGLTPATN